MPRSRRLQLVLRWLNWLRRACWAALVSAETGTWRTIRGEALAQSADFRALANMRVREAALLLRGSEWSGAYYLVGYAVECALKACLAREFRSWRMPDKNVLSQAYTHDLQNLARQCQLNQLIAAQGRADRDFDVNWALVKDWNEESRYLIWTETNARDLFRAVNDRNHGVLPWVKRQW